MKAISSKAGKEYKEFVVEVSIDEKLYVGVALSFLN